MSVIDIDDDENANWLHGKPKTKFEIAQGAKILGVADLKTQEIESEDEQLKEVFYALVGEEEIGEYDGGEFQERMEEEGYVATPLADDVQ